ncbi:hypothetical protein Bhyg_08253, partial [Pseudolycoriella hygida]
YLHFFYLPFVKFSFYAGTLTYKSAINVFNLLNNCKDILNTHGNGWRMSTFQFLKMNFNIQRISNHTKGLASESSKIFKDPCGNLILSSEDGYTSDYTDHQMIVPLPRIESTDNDSLVNAWLPFKHKRNFILNSKSSAFVLTKYYVDVVKCYQFRNVMSNPFNQRFRKLLNEKVLPLILNEEFYPGFGAILRVWETLKENGVTHRSTFKFDRIDDDVGNDYWDETVNLAAEADANFQIKINQSDEGKSVNETNFFLNMVDSMKNFEIEWNKRQKTKYIFLAFIVAFIALLSIILCVIIRRETQKKNVNLSALTREREKNWKTLLRKLSSKSEKTGLGIEMNSDHEFKFNNYEDTTSLVSETTERKQTLPTSQQAATLIVSASNSSVKKGADAIKFENRSSEYGRQSTHSEVDKNSSGWETIPSA